MIHLIGGESARGTLSKTAVPGDKFSIDDILMEGPIVDGLQTEASWEMRGDWLERHFAISKSNYLSGRAQRDRILTDSLSHDEIVLWFEFDLFCQANLLYFLNWYALQHLGKTHLTLICPETFPGRTRFRGLGELPGPELASLFPTRAVVTADQKRLAQRAWQAFSSKNPQDIQTVLDGDSSSLPLLAPALRGHLERFPSTTNGLGILAQKTLEILNSESLPFHQLFQRVTSTPEIFRHGMGDLQLQTYLEMWSSARQPLVIEEETVRITDAGRSVLRGDVDEIGINGIDVWYGGVHLVPNNLWRWNCKAQRLA